MAMILLPHGNPVKENVNPGKINFPVAMGKLRKVLFSGYLRFDYPAGFSVFIYHEGRLISALCEADGEKLALFEAIAKTFEKSLEGGGRLNIYRLSNDLALSLHALLHGEILHQGQDLKLIDIRVLLARLNDEQLSGGLRIYTKERTTLIFFRKGRPLGFFHDGSTEIETTADSSLSIAKQPGAKVDVLVSREEDVSSLVDLAETADIVGLWGKARS